MAEPTEIVWSDPPPSGWGASGGQYDWFYDELVRHPGRWAEFPANGDRDREYTLPDKRRRQGFRVATRKQHDGIRKVWLCYQPVAQ